jgi:mono/diheme cytochrome c family protein
MAHDTHDKTPANLPKATYEVHAPRLPRIPFLAVSVGLIAVVGSWIPLVLFARARQIPSSEPRVSFVQDMGTQPRYNAQQSSEVFEDGRAARLPIPGTVARGHLDEDDHYHHGFERVKGPDGKMVNKFFDTFPEQVKVTPALVKRGQDRFNIYCSVCHGLDGQGHGQVNEMAVEDKEAKWVQVASLPSDAVRVRPVGHIYNTINVGIRNMSGYGAQVPVADRWAIVAYVRSLQYGQNAPEDAVPAENRNTSQAAAK